MPLIESLDQDAEIQVGGKTLGVRRVSIRTWAPEISAGHLRGSGSRAGMGESQLSVEWQPDDLDSTFGRNVIVKLQDGRQMSFTVQPDGACESMGALWRPGG